MFKYEGRATRQRLDLDLSEARSYGVYATPTVMVNGRKYVGFRDEAAFAAAIDLAAQQSDKGRVGK
jgi:protein-disulfide isomerase